MDDGNTAATLNIKPDMLAWLKEMANHYDLPDEHKALRIVLVHAMEEADRDTLFTEVRCHYCD